jgi:hypothetical protein
MALALNDPFPKQRRYLAFLIVHALYESVTGSNTSGRRNRPMPRRDLGADAK